MGKELDRSTFVYPLVDTIRNPDKLTYENIKRLKEESAWRNLGGITIGQAIESWLNTLPSLTAKNYACGMRKLAESGILNPQQNLQAFALANNNAVVDSIKHLPEASESTRQARAAAFISLTRFLSRRTEGFIKKAEPSREGRKTFFRVREKVATEAMTREQWTAFLLELEKINPRDCLIAKLLLQGGKRASEVLLLETDGINWSAAEISFRQSKTKGIEKETVITFPQRVMRDLKNYVGGRRGIVFVTNSGKPVHITQLGTSFEKAGIRASIPFKVTPHVLRATTVTYLKQQGFSDSDIMKVTGHASAEMIYAYDKSERGENASKKISLI